MHVALGKGNGDILFVETDFDAFLQVEEEIPVVFDFHLGAESEVHAAVTHFHEANGWLGFGEDTRFVVEDTLEDILHFLDIVAVADAGDEIEAAGAFLRIVFNHATHGGGVGNDLGAVIEGEHGGGENAHLFNDTFAATGADIVTDLVGLEDEDEHAGREVGERTLLLTIARSTPLAMRPATKRPTIKIARAARILRP